MRISHNRMLSQTLNYLDTFARFTQKENVEAVERLLSAHKNLHKFERAQLGTWNFLLDDYASRGDSSQLTTICS